MKKQFSILLFILLLAGFFRFYQLNQVPPSPSLDEVSLGWNAYCLLETGRDEYGYRWPVLLRAYDDWRPAGYVYLVIPFVKIFGLTVVAVRLPSVLLSLITILTTYFLVKELFPINQPRRSASTQHSKYSALPLIASFFLVISPWHIYLSRLGHEVNLGLTLVVLAIFLFLRYVSPRRCAAGATPPSRRSFVGLILAALFFAFSFYSYQSLKIFTPLIVLVLIRLYWKQVLKDFKCFLIAGLLGLLISVPILKISLTQTGMVRFQATSLLAYIPEINKQSALRVARNYEQKNYLGLIFDNRRVAAGLAVLRAYFSHFDPSWLFFNAGRENHKIPNFGLFPLWAAPLLLIGIYQLAVGFYPRRTKRFLAIWLLLAPIPASLTTEAPHAMRSFNVLPVPQILMGLGAITVWERISKTWKKKAKIILSVFLVFHLAFLFHHYFVNFPFEQSDSFQYPLKKAIEYALVNQDQYQKIVVTNQKQGYQSYMFYLFFSRYPPETYLKNGGTKSGGYSEIHTIGKFEFRPIDWIQNQERSEILFIGNTTDFPAEVASKARFGLLNGEEAMSAAGEER